MLFPAHCRSYRIITPQSVNREFIYPGMKKKKGPIWGEEEDMLDWGEKKEIKLILFFMNGEMKQVMPLIIQIINDGMICWEN